MIKIADGAYAYNIDPQTKFDRVPDVVSALRQQGLAVWGWQYTYGAGPNSEANIAIQRIRQFDLDGFVIDAEQEYKESGKCSRRQNVRQQNWQCYSKSSAALSSYRFPSYNRSSLESFLEYVDINKPQFYLGKSA
jgi:hypothetical protein